MEKTWKRHGEDLEKTWRRHGEDMEKGGFHPIEYSDLLIFRFSPFSLCSLCSLCSLRSLCSLCSLHSLHSLRSLSPCSLSFHPLPPLPPPPTFSPPPSPQSGSFGTESGGGTLPRHGENPVHGSVCGFHECGTQWPRPRIVRSLGGAGAGTVGKSRVGIDSSR